MAEETTVELSLDANCRYGSEMSNESFAVLPLTSSIVSYNAALAEPAAEANEPGRRHDIATRTSHNHQ